MVAEHHVPRSLCTGIHNSLPLVYPDTLPTGAKEFSPLCADHSEDVVIAHKHCMARTGPSCASVRALDPSGNDILNIHGDLTLGPRKPSSWS